jgi:hypothetical protein
VLPLREPPEQGSGPAGAVAGSARPRWAVAHDGLAARLRGEPRSARCQVSVWEQVPAWEQVRAWRRARQVWLQVARHVLRAVVGYPEQGVLGVEAVTRLGVARPEAAVSVRQVAVFLQVAEAPSSARSAAVERVAPRSAGAKPSEVAGAGPAEEPDAEVGAVRPQVAAHAAGLRMAAERAVVAPQAAGVLDAAAVPLLGVAAGVLGAAAVPLPGVAAGLVGAVPLLAVARVAAEEAGAVRRRAARDEMAARRGAVVWVFRPDLLLPWPELRQAARSAHALQERSTALP